MYNNVSQEAAKTIWTHWQNNTRLDALPTDLRPANREEGYAVQAMLSLIHI